MPDRSAEREARIRANRFRHEENALSAALRALLGQAADGLEFVDLARADALEAECLASHRAADEIDSVVGHTWGESDIEVTVDTIHRVARNVGSRPVWCIVRLTEPHALVMPNDLPLDNPLGFAALAWDDGDLRLLDRELPAGLWLVRHTHVHGAGREYSWELSVWGEPWASAATRAMRGIG
jgi:hypothetical protein